MGKTRSSKPKDDYFLSLPDSMERALFQVQRSKETSPIRVPVDIGTDSGVEGCVTAPAGKSKTVVRGLPTRGRYNRSVTASRRSKVVRVNKKKQDSVSIPKKVKAKGLSDNFSTKTRVTGSYPRKTRKRAVGDSSSKAMNSEGRKRKRVNYAEPESEEDSVSNDDEEHPRMEVSSLKRVLEEINVSEKGKEEIGKGQVDDKLDFSGANQPIYKVNPKIITKLLMDSIIHSNKIFPSQATQLPEPMEECSAIVKALAIYSSKTSPTDSLNLFENGSTSSRGSAVNGERKKSRKEVKNWDYVAGLFEEYTFPEGFSDKMAQIMNTVAEGKISIPTEAWNINKDAPLENEESKWALFEVGCLLSYWLSKLYENRDFDEDRFPNKLMKGKTGFLELYENNYDYYIQFSPEDDVESDDDDVASVLTEAA